MGGIANGSIARLRFLRSLFHSRSVDAFLLDADDSRIAWSVAFRNSRVPLVRGYCPNRHDSHKRDLRDSPELCGAGGAGNLDHDALVGAVPRNESPEAKHPPGYRVASQ